MTVSDQIIQVLDALCEKFGIAIDWTSENIVPYVATLIPKLVSYEIWSSVAWMGMMVLMSVICIAVIRAFWEQISEANIDWDVWPVFVWIFAALIWSATIVTIGVQVMDIIKCVTFPEMYVFEYIQGVING